MKLNFSDEAIFNYFNYYTDSDKIYADFFNREIDQSNIKDDIDLSHVFFTELSSERYNIFSVVYEWPSYKFIFKYSFIFLDVQYIQIQFFQTHLLQ